MPASLPEQGLSVLFTRIGKLIDSKHGVWLSSLRLDDAAQDDPLYGWRARSVFFFGELSADRKVYRKTVKRLDGGTIDPSTRKHVREAGAFRSKRLVDHMPPTFFDGDHYQEHYIERGISDRLFVVMPANEDVESYFMFDRMIGEPAFSSADLDVATDALRSLAWFNRQLHLSYGQMAAEEPLTKVERLVLRSLLTGKPEKQIASELLQSVHTTHDHVKTLYRKFNVRSRAELTALWLGH